MSSASTISSIAATAAGDNNNTRHRWSPWTQSVRGDCSDAVATSAASLSAAAAVSEQPVVDSSSSSSSSGSWMVASAAEEEGCDHGGNAGKRTAWVKPANGGVEIGAVMGADLWPPLSESARASGSKPSQQDTSSKPVSDGSSSLSVTVSQGSGSGSPSTQKQMSPNSISATPNHTIPARQRSTKRIGGGAPNPSSSNSNAPSQPLGPQQRPQIGEANLNNPSYRDHAAQRNLQSRGGNDHTQQQHQRNSFRRNHNYGGRRDQDNQDLNNHRNSSGRDAHMHPHRGFPRFPRHQPPPPPPPPTTSTSFIAPPAMRPFGSPIGFHASPMYFFPGPPHDPLRAIPFVAAPMPMYFAAPDIQLHSEILNQIEYYFSNENLIKDTFLRQNMDDQGWVPIELIAGFNKVSRLTDNIQLVLDAIRNSSVVEVQGDKVRKRNDWKRWVMPSSIHFLSVSGPPSLGRSNLETMAAHVQNISLEENATSTSSGKNQADFHNESNLARSSTRDISSQSWVSSSEGTGQVSVQDGSDSSTSTRNPSK